VLVGSLLLWPCCCWLAVGDLGFRFFTLLGGVVFFLLWLVSGGGVVVIVFLSLFFSFSGFWFVFFQFGIFVGPVACFLYGACERRYKSAVLFGLADLSSSWTFVWAIGSRAIEGG